MNNQNYQILLGIILLVVYFTCFRKSEGFFGMIGRPMIGKEYCFNKKASLYGVTRDVRSIFGLLRGSPRVLRNCKDGKVRKVIAQVSRLQTYKSHKKNFLTPRKRYYRKFKYAKGWVKKPLPSDSKKKDKMLLDLAAAGYQSMIVRKNEVHVNKRLVPLRGWTTSWLGKTRPPATLMQGRRDPTAQGSKMRSRLRTCHMKLRQCRAGNKPPAARAPAMAPAKKPRIRLWDI